MTRHEGFVYLLKSDADGSLYFGSTNDINRRITEHNEGKSAATRHRRPWKLVCVLKLQHISHARRTEQFLKASKQKITLIWFLEELAKSLYPFGS